MAAANNEELMEGISPVLQRPTPQLSSETQGRGGVGGSWGAGGGLLLAGGGGVQLGGCIQGPGPATPRGKNSDNKIT